MYVQRPTPAPSALATLVAVACLALPAGSPAQEGSGSGAPALAVEGSGQAAPAAGADEALRNEGSGEALASGAQIVVTGPEPAEILVGEPVRLDVRVALPPFAELVSVRPADPRYVEVLSVDDPPPVDGVATWTVTLTLFRPGRFTVPGLEATWLTAEGETERLTSDPFSVHVRSTIVNESAPSPAPSDGPMPVLTRDRRPLYVGVAFALLAFGALLGLLIRQFVGREDDEVGEIVPTRPAWETAFEALDALREDALLEADAHLEFHMRLSEILRVYLGARFGFLALEMTTTEIRYALHGIPERAGEYQEEIVRVLSEMDMVKFARVIPPIAISEAAWDAAHGLVEDLSARERELAAAAEAEALAQTDDDTTTPPTAHPLADPIAPTLAAERPADDADAQVADDGEAQVDDGGLPNSDDIAEPGVFSAQPGGKSPIDEPAPDGDGAPTLPPNVLPFERAPEDP